MAKRLSLPAGPGSGGVAGLGVGGRLLRRASRATVVTACGRAGKGAEPGCAQAAEEGPVEPCCVAVVSVPAPVPAVLPTR